MIAIGGNAAQFPVANFGNGISQAVSIAALQALDEAAANQQAYLDANERSGLFVWHSGDHSAEVAADPGQGVWVAPSSDTSGASGAWKRVHSGGTVHAGWFGASPSAAASDNATRLNYAVQYAAANNLLLVLDTGEYLVDAPLRPVPTLIDADSKEEFGIAGVQGGFPYNSSGKPSTIRASGAFPVGESVLDFRYCSKVYIGHLAVDGGGTGFDAAAIELGARSGSSTYGMSHIEAVSTYASRYGIRGRNAGVLKVHKSNISGWHYVGIYLDTCGDVDLQNNFINSGVSSVVDYVGSDIFTGTGVLFAGGSSNCNISGGKIEYTSKGIVIYDSQGINISGINFDVNKQNAILINGSAATLPDQATSISVTNCRFLASGIIADGVDGLSTPAAAAGSHIAFQGGASQTTRAAIVGNTFRRGSIHAYDENAETDAVTYDAVGPLRAIYLVGDIDADLVISGNDLWNAANDYALFAWGASFELEFIGNKTNLPFSTGGGGTIYQGAFKNRDSAFTARQSFSNGLLLTPEASAPASPTSGTLAVSDGTGGGFDAASGAGLYRYNGAAWVFLG